MRFAYPLQKIVDLKANEKKQAESDLSQAIMTLTEEERKRDELVTAKHSFQERVTGEDAVTLTVSDLMLTQHYIDHLDDQIRRTDRSIDQAEQNVEQTRQHLTDRMIDEKIWAKAREKALTVHMAEAEKAAQNELDDAAILRRRNA